MLNFTTMKKTLTLLGLFLLCNTMSFSQIVVYDIIPADFIGLTLTSGDQCSAPLGSGPEEAKQWPTAGNIWGFTWTSTGSGTPSSVQIDFYNTITDGGGSYPTTLNTTASGNVVNGTAINCSGGSIANTWSILPASYIAGGTNTFNVDFAGSSMVNQFDHFPTTTNVYFRVTVDYTPCTPPTVAETITNIACFGAKSGAIDITATGTGPFTFDWDTDGTGDFDDTEDLTGLNAGTYNVVVKDANGCTTPGSYTVTEAAPLDVAVSLSNGTFTANATGVSYQWVECPGYLAISGEIAQTFTPEVNGGYAVVITSGACSDTSACQTISNVGIQQADLTQIAVYPNPANEQISINLSGINHPTAITIYDMAGKKVMEPVYSKSGGELLTLSISQLELGNYWIELKNEEQTSIIQLSKK